MVTDAFALHRPVPVPGARTSLPALGAMLRKGHPLAALQVFHDETSDVFQIQLPGFSPIVLVGPQAARFVLVESRDELRWRTEDDPITRLLRHGLLVEDGVTHDQVRGLMSPSLHRRMLAGYLDEMWPSIDQITAAWNQEGVVDMLVEMRKITLLILTRTLFRHDFHPEMGRLWDAVLALTRYISLGPLALLEGHTTVYTMAAHPRTRSE